MSTPPEAAPLTGRPAEIVAAARELLEEDGWDALSMRVLAGRLGMRAPSLYKHVAGKEQLRDALVATGLREMGAALHDAVGDDDPGGPAVDRLLQAYRRHALANDRMYRLATSGALRRESLPQGLEDWAGRPFLLATGDPVRAQALWAAAHGLAILELDGRFPPGSPLDDTWATAAAAFGVT